MSDERYEIRGKIGQGGVGAVYRAYDRNLNREVAIKRVLTEEGFDANDSEDEATKSLLKEAIALCSVQHPHIVTVYDAGADEDGPYVVMELLSGRTMDEMVERGTMTWGDFRETAIQTQEALIAAQELNIVHRDIKPSNVMVTWLPSGKFQVKLVDFGLAKFSAKPSLQTIDHGDAVFGSIHFMAPEQFERTPLDKRTDMYSLGCVFYFALTGQYPFDGETAPQVMASHLQNSYTPIKELRPDIPDWACEWIQWHIARSPDERPKDAREALERFFAFDQPVNSATTPVDVQSVPASSLASGQVPASGPVPVSASSTGSTAQRSVRLITGPVLEKTKPATAPVLEAQGRSGPKPLDPPPGSKPSIHSSAQVVKATTGPVPVHATTAVTVSSGGGTATGAVPIPPTTAQVKAPKNNSKKIMLAVVLGVVAIVLGVVLNNVISAQKERGELQALLAKAANPTISSLIIDGDELDSLLGFIASPSFDSEKNAAFVALTKADSTDGTDIDREVSEVATRKDSLNDQVRVKLFQALEQRGNASAMPVLVDYIGESTDEGPVVAAIKAMRPRLSGNEVPALIELISVTGSNDIRSAAERTLEDFIPEQSSTGSISRQLATAYETASDTAVKQSFIRLLGAAGGSRAEKLIGESLESQDNGMRVAAYAALASWPNDSFFEKHVEAMLAETDPLIREQAFDSLIEFLQSEPETGSITKLGKMWSELAAEAENAREKRMVISVLARKGGNWTLGILKRFQNDKNGEIASLASRAVSKVNQRKAN